MQGGGSFNITSGEVLKKITNLQSSLINIESIERFKVTADIISILIHNNTLQSFVWSSIALKFSVSDPCHFDADPDPRIRIRDDGSGSEVTFDSVNRIFPINVVITII